MDSSGFRDRGEAGRALSDALAGYRVARPVIVGLTRGGVPVALQVALGLAAPLDVCVVRKVGAPGQPELGIGAVAEGGEVVLDESSVALAGVPPGELSALVARKLRELEGRVRLYRRGAPPIDVSGRTVIVVDDGLATGGTARAALRAMRGRGASHLVLAVPVGAVETLEALRDDADAVVCLLAPPDFRAVGRWYEDFGETTDAEVLEALSRAQDRGGRGPGEGARPSAPVARNVEIPAAGALLGGHLDVPPDARGVVLFAHGSGSSRNSPRNQQVAAELRRTGLATLLFDLLTPTEERLDAGTRELRFDIDLLAERLAGATRWVGLQAETMRLAVGYFGASTGAAAALLAAANEPEVVRAVVSRGGRPDLAGPALGRVRSPTLLLVGGEDDEVLDLNWRAYRALQVEKRVTVVPGATHLFEEPGALEAVARAAGEWFVRYLPARCAGAPGETIVGR